MARATRPTRRQAPKRDVPPSQSRAPAGSSGRRLRFGRSRQKRGLPVARRQLQSPRSHAQERSPAVPRPQRRRCSTSAKTWRAVRISVTTIGDVLLNAADRYPDTPALVFPDREITYAELARNALRRARSLQATRRAPGRPRRHPDAYVRRVRGDVVRDRILRRRHRADQRALQGQRTGLRDRERRHRHRRDHRFDCRLRELRRTPGQGAARTCAQPQRPAAQTGGRAASAQHRAARPDHGAGIRWRGRIRGGRRRAHGLCRYTSRASRARARHRPDACTPRAPPRIRKAA